MNFRFQDADWRKYARRAGWGAVVAIAGMIAAGVGVGVVIYAMVYFGDDSSLKKSTILARINEETAIFCEDGVTPIGHFFATEHRRYVTIDEIPANTINALVAAEDKNFFKHNGVDPTAIIKAFFDGLKTGHFRGGSTLTQQTVKNILDKWEYSLQRKIREANASLQLERLYSKKQILEFYFNQFHVSGNGTGIGIAAKYYFNKEVRDLNLVESAFVAGSVKGPSKYDPFIKYTKERREQAVRNAFERKNYVLRRMYEQGWVTEQEFRDAWAAPVPFNRGSFRSQEVALVSLVRGQLERRDILDQLGLESVDELNTSGLKVYTTLDCKLQEATQLGMRRNLSRLETILGGFKPEAPDKYKKLRELTVNEFYFGKVEEVVGTPKDAFVKVSFGLSSGIIPYESLRRYAMLLDLPILEGPEVQLKKLLKELKIGEIIFVEVKEYDREKHEAVLELHRRPRINGGIVAIDKGEVRVAVSGFDTKGFNRAMFAKRQPGSVFKSVVYYAGLQLGWSVLDRLDNERQVFPYQMRLYFPRPDHASPYKDVSMLWAGTMSENLASVYLTARLVDRLNLDQFKQLMGTMDLLPLAGEAPRDFHYRVAKATGVQLDNEGVREYQLRNTINDIAPDLIFGGQQEILRKISKMWWGKGYVNELQNLYVQEGDAMPAYEKALRIGLIKNNYLRTAALAASFSNDWDVIVKKIAEKGAEAAFSDPSTQHLWGRFKVLASVGNRPSLGYFASLEGEDPRRDFERRGDIERIVQVPGRRLNALDVQSIWSSGVFSSADLTANDVFLDGFLTMGTFRKMQQMLNERYEQAMAKTDEYDLYRYYQHHDFRIGLGLKYLVELTKALGVTSKIEAVMSFPLGTNDVSAAEVAKVYQTFMTGKIYQYFEKGPPNQLNLIRRIEDRYGNMLLEPKRIEKVVSLPEYSAQMIEILKRVVTHGTGRRARGELYASLGGEPEVVGDAPKKAKDAPDSSPKVRIPAFGKTGTTNDYNNAYFAGFFPYPTEKGEPLDFEHGYAIASYVGYDLNKTMRRGAVKVSGSVGALPTWIDLAKGMIEGKKYADFIDPLDLNVIAKGEWPMRYDNNISSLKVDIARGVTLGNSEETDSEVFGTTDILKTGERPDNEFAVGSTVKAVVRIPEDKSAGGPLRIFSPLKFAQDGKGVTTTSPVILDPKNTPQQTFPAAAASRPSDPASSPEAPGLTPVPNAAAKPNDALPVPGSPENANGYTGPAEELEAAPMAPTQNGAGKTASPSSGVKPLGATNAPAKVPSDEDLFSDPATEKSGKGKQDWPAGKENEKGFVEEDLW